MGISNNYTANFFLSQLQVILLGIFITGLMQLANHLDIYLVICCPFLFFLMIIEYCLYWKSEGDRAKCFNFVNICVFIAGFAIFFGVFFGIFHPTAKLEFEKVENCYVSGSYSKQIENEKYSLLHINFEYKYNQYLQYKCASNFNQPPTTETKYSYKFLNFGDGISCDDKTDEIDNRLLTSIQRARNLKSGISGASINYRVGRRWQSGQKRSCAKGYNFSEVKLASWLCIGSSFDLEEYSKNQSCYVHFYNDEANAKENGENRIDPRIVSDFPLISFKSEAYYPKAGLIFLILFAYYPFLLSFNSIFQYTSNYILKCFGMD